MASSTGATETGTASDAVLGAHDPWIVYQRYDPVTKEFRIRVIQPNGKGDHALLPESAEPKQAHPDWSPDGSRIVFVQGDKRIWTVDADGSHLAQLPIPCDSTCQFVDAPAWSPDGRWIAYTRQDQPPGKDPYTRVQKIDVTNGSISTIYTPPPAVGTSWVRWSPDGRSLVIDLETFPDISSAVVTGSAVAVVDLATSIPKARLLTPYTMFASYPDWSRTSGRIVFTTYDLGVRDAGNFADPSPASNLYTIRPDGTGLTQLTHNTKGASLMRNRTASGPLSTQPTWTSDGQRIMFVKVDGTSWPGWTMATINADGSGLASAVSTGYLLGTHPRLRPTPS